MSNDTGITVVTAIVAVGLFLYIARRIGKIAERRGRNYYTWAVFAFLLPVPAIVLVYILPNKAPPDLTVAIRHFERHSAAAGACSRSL